eukprot:Skav226263  [mRNA]  locus=scaffold2708:168741:173468:+ [translate_table: standard]
MGRAAGRHVRSLFGAPAPSRTVDSQSGTWTGVATVSDYPCAVVPVDWSPGVFDCGRTLLSSHFVGPLHVVVGSLYGFAQSPSHRDPLGATRLLLQSLTHELSQCRGPRVLMGDFNCDLLQFPELVFLRSQGWQEIQIQALQVHHKPVEPTCKRTTVRDYVWCSPELLAYYDHTLVHHDWFPDHSAVCASFRVPWRFADPRFWPQPKPLPWDHIRKEDWHAAVDTEWIQFPWTSETTKDFACWSSQVEQSLTSFVGTPHGRLPSGTGGRGQHLHWKKGPVSQPVARPARAGEEPMCCSFPTRNLVRWYRQLRRLQSLLHSCRKGVVSPSASSYQAHCWSAVLRAPGFSPGFARWWRRRPIRLQASPLDLQGLPPLGQLERIFEDFRLNYRHLETWTQKQRLRLVQAKRESSLKELFRTMRPDGPAPLDFITETHEIPILAVDPPTGAVSVEGGWGLSAGMWDVAGERVFPLSCDGPAHSLERSWCLFDSDTLCVPGTALHQTRVLTEVPDLHKALLDFWTPRWQAMQDVPAEAWTRIRDFTRAYIPRRTIPCPVLSPEDLLTAFRSGSGLRTGGPDGWRREDIQSLPAAFLTDAVQLFQHVERGHDWPQQLTRGHVTCLQKTASNYDVSNYRPIVLFSLWYRLWGCLRARYYLAQLERFADFAAFGFLQGRSCQDLTFAIQSSIEVALRTGASACGALFDVEKCFNCIPRAPIMFLAEWFGIDPGVIHAWTSFLTLMHRSFMVHQQPSDAVLSNCGLPEGDSMSCLGMVLLNFSYHFYMRHFHPQVNAMSYVDNLELFTEQPGQLLAAVACLSAWSDMFCLRLDLRKSSCWALTPTARRALQELTLPVVESGADLGAAMIYGAQHRNKVLQDRIQATFPFFRKLRSLGASLWHKVLIIKMALLPRALHAAALTFIGDHWIVKLRTALMRCLRFDRAGANPSLRLGFVCDLAVEPGYFVAWRIFQSVVLSLRQNRSVRQCWAQYLQAAVTKRTFGPFGNFLRTLEKLGWELQGSDALVVAPDFELSLTATGIDQWKGLFDWHWRQYLVQGVAHRHDYEGLCGIDTAASFFPMSHLDKPASELLNCVRDGTFFLNTTKAKYDAINDGCCPHCGNPDTLEHRALHCRFYTAVRLRFLDVVNLWWSLPVCMTHHGLAPRNPWQIEFWQQLSQLSWDPPQWMHAPVHAGHQRLYTDGSCQNNGSTELALAGWSLVSADVGQPLALGLLPGIGQSNNRAELFAVIMGVHWLIVYGCTHGSISTDSQYVYDGYQFLAVHFSVPTDWDDRDLWDELLIRIQIYTGSLELRKLRAHLSLTDSSSEQDPFDTYWNSIADLNAKVARINERPAALASVYQSLVRTFEWHSFWCKRCQEYLMSLAQHSLKGPDVSVQIFGQEPEEEFVSMATVALNSREFCDQFPLDLRNAIGKCPALVAFGPDISLLFCNWLLQLDRDASVVSKVTYFELLVGFCCLTNAELPVAVQSHSTQQWIPVTDSCVGLLMSRTLKSKIDTLQHLVAVVFGCFGLELNQLLISKPDIGILKPLPGIVCPWPDPVADLVSTHVAGYTAAHPIRWARDLARAWP